MQTAAKPAKTVRTILLAALEARPYRPAELLETLQSGQISAAQLKDELTKLIDEHLVILSPDRYIKVAGR